MMPINILHGTIIVVLCVRFGQLVWRLKVKLYSPANFLVQKQDLLQGFDELFLELTEIGEEYNDGDQTFIDGLSLILPEEEFQKRKEIHSNIRDRHSARHKEVEELRKIFADDAFGVISEEILDRTSTLFKENLLRSAIFLAHSRLYNKEMPRRPMDVEEIQLMEKRVVTYAAAYGTLMRDKDPEEAFQVYPFGEERFQEIK